MTKRRDFLKHGSYWAAGTMLLPMACGTKSQKAENIAEESLEEVVSSTTNKSIGVQVYSVRDALQEDFAGSMARLSEIGYQYIEAYGLTLDGKLFGMDPAEYKKVVNDLGMELISSHSTYFTPDQAEVVIESAQKAGLKYLIIPWLDPEYRTDFRAIADNLNKVGELFKGSGIKFGYHNHDFEFEKKNGEVPFEIMLNETDPSLVTFEADLYWIVKAGADPMALINKYPGRFSAFHVKDANEQLDQTTVGTGIVDFETILSNRDKAGLAYYFVEDERTDDPFGNLKANFDYLNQSDFA